MNMTVGPLHAKNNNLIPLQPMISDVVVIHPIPMMRYGLASSLFEVGLRTRTFASWQDARHEASGSSHSIIICDQGVWQRNVDSFGLLEKKCLIILASIQDKLGDDSRHKDVTFVPDTIRADDLQKLLCEKGANTVTGNMANGSKTSKDFNVLSPRQLQILGLMAKGLLNKQIAWELGLTEGTIKSHVSAILEKLKCSRRTQAIASYIQSYKPHSEEAQAFSVDIIP